MFAEASAVQLLKASVPKETKVCGSTTWVKAVPEKALAPMLVMAVGMSASLSFLQ